MKLGVSYIVVEDGGDVIGGEAVCRERHEHAGLTNSTCVAVKNEQCWC